MACGRCLHSFSVVSLKRESQEFGGGSHRARENRLLRRKTEEQTRGWGRVALGAVEQGMRAQAGVGWGAQGRKL